MKQTRKMLFIALIAAIYTAATLALAPLSFGGLQIRISEALVLLPLLFKDSIYGVTLGCILANFIGALMGINMLGYFDVVIGSVATFIAAYSTYQLRNIKIKNVPVLSLIMPVIINGLFVGLELAYVLTPATVIQGFIIFGTQVAIGELIAVTVIGLPLINLLKKHKLKERFNLK